MSMKKVLLCLCCVVSLELFASCAAQQEDPQPPLGEKVDTTRVWKYRPEENESFAVPTPKQHVDPEREYFVLPSDSTRITESGGEVWLTVRGPLVNGCQRHEYYDSVTKGSTLYLTFWGSKPTDSTVVCTEQAQGYDRDIHLMSSSYTRFSVIQPDGTTRAYSLGTAQISQK
jgi:hypothetical protein